MLAFTYRVGQCHGFGPCFIQPVDVDVAVHISGGQEISRPIFIDKQGLVSGIMPQGAFHGTDFDSAFWRDLCQKDFSCGISALVFIMGGQYDFARLFIIVESDALEVYVRIECYFPRFAPTVF